MYNQQAVKLTSFFIRTMKRRTKCLTFSLVMLYYISVRIFIKNDSFIIFFLNNEKREEKIEIKKTLFISYLLKYVCISEWRHVTDIIHKFVSYIIYNRIDGYCSAKSNIIHEVVGCLCSKGMRRYCRYIIVYMMILIENIKRQRNNRGLRCLRVQANGNILWWESIKFA